MKQMQLSAGLNVHKPAIISFIGGGGKTSLIHKLALELTGQGRRVIITTTTKMRPVLATPLFCEQNFSSLLVHLDRHLQDNLSALAAAKFLADGKLEGFPPGIVDKMAASLGATVLVEADGSRGLPLKGHRDDEPLLPPTTALTAAVIGADALDRPVDKQTVHCPERITPFAREREGEKMGEALLARVFAHMSTLARRQAGQSKVVPIINKVDLLHDGGPRLAMLAHLYGGAISPGPFLGTAAALENPLRYIFAPQFPERKLFLSAIVLAAGRAERMGRDKLSLPFRSSTILGTTLAELSLAPVDEIIVVTTRDRRVISPPGYAGVFKVVESSHPSRVFATSLKVGLSAVDPRAQGILFALGDQPLLSSDHYRLLAEHYRRRIKPVTSLAQGSRIGNPAIFDRRTWPTLTSLKGEEGGKTVIARLAPTDIDAVYLPDSTVLFDIDTSVDYQRLLDLE